MRHHAHQALAEAFGFTPEFFLSQSPGHLTTVGMRTDHLRALQDALIEMGPPHSVEEERQAQVLSAVLTAAQRTLGGQPLSGLPGQMTVPVVLDGGLFRTIEALQHPTEPLEASGHAP